MGAKKPIFKLVPRELPLDPLFRAAEKHGKDSGADHEVGDLQGVLIEAWDLMDADQRRELQRTDAYKNTLEWLK